MRKVYYLATCNTCKRILADLKLGEDFEFQEIKSSPVTAEQLDQMKILAGSYEALFSKVARKYREWNLKDKALSENHFRDYILDEYTFLKRPVIIIGDQIFVGSSKQTIEQVRQLL